MRGEYLKLIRSLGIKDDLTMPPLASPKGEWLATLSRREMQDACQVLRTNLEQLTEAFSELDRLLCELAVRKHRMAVDGSTFLEELQALLRGLDPISKAVFELRKLVLDRTKAVKEAISNPVQDH